MIAGGHGTRRTRQDDTTRKSRGITGRKTTGIPGLQTIAPRMTLVIQRPDGTQDKVPVTFRIDTAGQVTNHHVLRQRAGSEPHAAGGAA